jgi:transposase
VAVDRIRDRVAGLDVHRDSVVACLRLAVGGDVETVKRSFSTMSAGVAELAAWLGDHEVGTVVMEATGVYWKPIVRHEALLNRVGMRGPHLGAVAAVR